MFAIVASAFVKVGGWAAQFGSQVCIGWFWDEPECPKNLIR